MGNEFYDPGQERGARVSDLFTRIAPRYDLINDLQSFGLHRYWKSLLVRMAQAKRDERVLDLCCGTGDLALRLARDGARVIGADFNQRMLAVAMRRSRSLMGNTDHVASGNTGGTPSLHLIQSDALRLPFPDGAFDIVTMAYGLRNLANVKVGLSEMQRVARPGGRLLVLDFGKPDNAVWRKLYFGYLKLFVPILGLIFCGSASAYGYILESLRYYPAQRGVAQQMSELGLANVRILNLLGGVMGINYAEKPAARPKPNRIR
jgi:demethylmenaquinone methyltransferase/2-methoxy-6-polyprenyl-1,4-benzoquinol methylase